MTSRRSSSACRGCGSAGTPERLAGSDQPQLPDRRLRAADLGRRHERVHQPHRRGGGGALGGGRRRQRRGALLRRERRADGDAVRRRRGDDDAGALPRRSRRDPTGGAGDAPAAHRSGAVRQRVPGVRRDRRVQGAAAVEVVADARRVRRGAGRGRAGSGGAARQPRAGRPVPLRPAVRELPRHRRDDVPDRLRVRRQQRPDVGSRRFLGGGGLRRRSTTPCCSTPTSRAPIRPPMRRGW